VQAANSREIRHEGSGPGPLLAHPVLDLRRLSSAAPRQVLREWRSDVLPRRLLSASITTNIIVIRPYL